MKSIKFLEGLRERKSEIESELASVKPLIDELAMVNQLLARHEHTEPIELFVEPDDNVPLFTEPAPLRVFGPRRRHSFERDPSSFTSRVLDAARQVLEETPKHEAPFLRLYKNLPPGLNGSGKARERARIALRRSGRRVGIEYVNKGKVRLVS